MFGYISVNKDELKFKDYNTYQTFYCGLCHNLQKRHRRRGQLTLSFDMTFLLVLLSGLYEPDSTTSSARCIAHPWHPQALTANEFTSYVGDMNLVLSYFKCQDDWIDDRQYSRLLYGKLLASEYHQVQSLYPQKTALIAAQLDQIITMEKNQEQDMDKISGCFGKVMAEIFAPRADQWEDTLKEMGFYLGKFIYFIDAYDDIEKDLKTNSYNPLVPLFNQPDFEERCHHILTLMLAECARAFEKLPIIEYADILRNILYSGVWCRYETIKQRRAKEQEQ